MWWCSGVAKMASTVYEWEMCTAYPSVTKGWGSSNIPWGGSGDSFLITLCQGNRQSGPVCD